MMKKYIYLCVFCFSISGLAFEYRCPESVETTQSLVFTPEGWRSLSDKTKDIQPLERMTIFDGNPEEKASLVPDNEGAQQDLTWTNHTLKGFWMACSYSQTTARLIREIPRTVKKCVLKLKSNSAKTQKLPDVLICN